MKTDSIFYRIFKTDPGILFELLDLSPEIAQGYEVESQNEEPLSIPLS
ncbi:DUF2887 domain-containing protein [Acaryochloris marina]|uniref:DUF2887 domain-containing protein n=1 Tax=Acaryochloris marina (strain MBIC 11017) TaxID=329726 RepID=A8ZLL6_ACAM1|nr:DUF2887 domain-containing protein [Acaryochloris marina]ABW32043.1 conserved hypothetical protein [Acaryochloris marina MBIC11017]